MHLPYKRVISSENLSCIIIILCFANFKKSETQTQMDVEMDITGVSDPVTLDEKALVNELKFISTPCVIDLSGVSSESESKGRVKVMGSHMDVEQTNGTLLPSIQGKHAPWTIQVLSNVVESHPESTTTTVPVADKTEKKKKTSSHKKNKRKKKSKRPHM